MQIQIASYIYIYIYMCVCVCVCVCMYVCVCVCACIHPHFTKHTGLQNSSEMCISTYVSCLPLTQWHTHILYVSALVLRHFLLMQHAQDLFICSVLYMCVCVCVCIHHLVTKYVRLFTLRKWLTNRNSKIIISMQMHLGITKRKIRNASNSLEVCISDVTIEFINHRKYKWCVLSL